MTRTAVCRQADPFLARWGVAPGVARAGGEDPFCGEHRRDGVESFTGDELGEDATHDRCGHRVGFEMMQAPSVVRFARVGVRAGIGEPVSEGRPAALEASFDRDLCFHRSPDACLHAVAFAFAHAAVERHDDLVGVAAGVNWSTDLEHPELDAVVHEDRECEAELIAVERSMTRSSAIRFRSLSNCTPVDEPTYSERARQ